jgi:polyphosphate kinase 2 (PPK2 family)
LAQDVERLAKLKERLYAHDRWALLVVLQSMDASGKDVIIKHVMSGINPQGCQVHPFKAPSAEELDHDFLWRAATRLPKRGDIGIFNRSHYEEVLVVRVHPDLLARQKLPDVLVTIHISREEQRRRLLARVDDPAKRWKFSMSDVADRMLWGKYMDAYEDMIRATSRPEAPWHVVPADHKSFARLVVAGAMIEALEGLNLEYPKIEGTALEELQKVRDALLSEEPG